MSYLVRITRKQMVIYQIQSINQMKKQRLVVQLQFCFYKRLINLGKWSFYKPKVLLRLSFEFTKYKY